MNQAVNDNQIVDSSAPGGLQAKPMLPLDSDTVPAPKVTLEQIEGVIAGEQYVQPVGTTLTICILMLRNGFTVTGESACVSPENFDADYGRKLAREDAVRKIWRLEGYVLSNTLSARVVDELARIAHEVNRAYCQELGDFSVPTWYEAPDWQKNSVAQGVLFVLNNPNATPADSHENWMKQKQLDGWTYGLVKDAKNKTHPCMVSYDQLPLEQRAKDAIFRALVLTIARSAIRS